MNIKPLGTNLLIKIHESGYTAMQQLESRDNLIEKATIVAIGDEVSKLAVGDIIFFKDYETDRIFDKDETYVIIGEEFIRAICTTNTPSEQ